MTARFCLALRLRRFSAGGADYLDLLDVPRRLAALGQYDDLADVAEQAVTQVLSGTLTVAAAPWPKFVPSSHPPNAPGLWWPILRAAYS